MECFLEDEDGVWSTTTTTHSRTTRPSSPSLPQPGSRRRGRPRSQSSSPILYPHPTSQSPSATIATSTSAASASAIHSPLPLALLALPSSVSLPPASTASSSAASVLTEDEGLMTTAPVKRKRGRPPKHPPRTLSSDLLAASSRTSHRTKSSSSNIARSSTAVRSSSVHSHARASNHNSANNRRDDTTCDSSTSNNTALASQAERRVRQLGTSPRRASVKSARVANVSPSRGRRCFEDEAEDHDTEESNSLDENSSEDDEEAEDDEDENCSELDDDTRNHKSSPDDTNIHIHNNIVHDSVNVDGLAGAAAASLRRRTSPLGGGSGGSSGGIASNTTNASPVRLTNAASAAWTLNRGSESTVSAGVPCMTASHMAVASRSGTGSSSGDAAIATPTGTECATMSLSPASLGGAVTIADSKAACVTPIYTHFDAVGLPLMPRRRFVGSCDTTDTHRTTNTRTDDANNCVSSDECDAENGCTNHDEGDDYWSGTDTQHEEDEEKACAALRHLVSAIVQRHHKQNDGKQPSLPLSGSVTRTTNTPLLTHPWGYLSFPSLSLYAAAVAAGAASATRRPTDPLGDNAMTATPRHEERGINDSMTASLRLSRVIIPIVVGSTVRLVNPEKREKSHRWTVYVRGLHNGYPSRAVSRESDVATNGSAANFVPRANGDAHACATHSDGSNKNDTDTGEYRNDARRNDTFCPSDDSSVDYLSHFIDKVVFILDRSFTPYVRVVHSAPFELTEVGWGEFVVTMHIYLRCGDRAEGGVRCVRHRLRRYRCGSQGSVALRHSTGPGRGATVLDPVLHIPAYLAASNHGHRNTTNSSSSSSNNNSSGGVNGNTSNTTSMNISFVHASNNISSSARFGSSTMPATPLVGSAASEASCMESLVQINSNSAARAAFYRGPFFSPLLQDPSTSEDEEENEYYQNKHNNNNTRASTHHANTTATTTAATNRNCENATVRSTTAATTNNDSYSELLCVKKEHTEQESTCPLAATTTAMSQTSTRRVVTPTAPVGPVRRGCILYPPGHPRHDDSWKSNVLQTLQGCGGTAAAAMDRRVVVLAHLLRFSHRPRLPLGIPPVGDIRTQVRSLEYAGYSLVREPVVTESYDELVVPLSLWEESGGLCRRCQEGIYCGCVRFTDAHAASGRVHAASADWKEVGMDTTRNWIAPSCTKPIHPNTGPGSDADRDDNNACCDVRGCLLGRLAAVERALRRCVRGYSIARRRAGAGSMVYDVLKSSSAGHVHNSTNTSTNANRKLLSNNDCISNSTSSCSSSSDCGNGSLCSDSSYSTSSNGAAVALGSHGVSSSLTALPAQGSANVPSADVCGGSTTALAAPVPAQTHTIIHNKNNKSNNTKSMTDDNRNKNNNNNSLSDSSLGQDSSCTVSANTSMPRGVSCWPLIVSHGDAAEKDFILSAAYLCGLAASGREEGWLQPALTRLATGSTDTGNSKHGNRGSTNTNNSRHNDPNISDDGSNNRYGSTKRDALSANQMDHTANEGNSNRVHSSHEKVAPILHEAPAVMTKPTRTTDYSSPPTQTEFDLMVALMSMTERRSLEQFHQTLLPHASAIYAAVLSDRAASASELPSQHGAVYYPLYTKSMPTRAALPFGAAPSAGGVHVSFANGDRRRSFGHMADVEQLVELKEALQEAIEAKRAQLSQAQAALAFQRI